MVIIIIIGMCNSFVILDHVSCSVVAMNIECY